jgi:UDP-GlcNAc3NAcA epimerase
MKIVTVLGARPQFIKASVLSSLIMAHPQMQEILIHTGQHYDSMMSQIFFQEMGIPQPQHYLEIGSATHGAQTGRMMERLETVVLEEKPDLILVYGDTNSTLAGALVASKLHIPLAHVEAGLRSYNKRMPEEINRILTDHMSDLLFAPTQQAINNLKKEGIGGESVILSGDIMYDVAKHYLELACETSQMLKQLNLTSKNYLLLTIHRAENTNNPTLMRELFSKLTEIAKKMTIVFPIHPRTQKTIQELNIDLGQIVVIPPVGYLDMTMLQFHAKKIITDSGGVQKEGYFYGVPCLVIRDQTEWVELTEIGFNTLIKNQDISNIDYHLNQPILKNYQKDIYGVGQSAKIILEKLLSL